MPDTGVEESSKAEILRNLNDRHDRKRCSSCTITDNIELIYREVVIVDRKS